MRYLLDTNACIALLNGRPPSLVDRVHRHTSSEFRLPAPVTYELYYGAFKSRYTDRNLGLLDRIAFEVVSFDAGAARARWGPHGDVLRLPRSSLATPAHSNVIESPFASVRLRTDAAKRYKKVANATALIWRVLMVAEKRFRKLNAPHLMTDVYAGEQYEDGAPVEQRKKIAA